MFEISKELLNEIKNAIQPNWRPAFEGPQVEYVGACGGGSCRGVCASNCVHTCYRGCKGVGKGS